MSDSGAFVFKRRTISLGGLAALIAVAVSSMPAAAATYNAPTTSLAATGSSSAQSTVGPGNKVAAPDSTLPKGWRQSSDRAATVSGDGAGLHVLVADSSQAYAWRTVATLAEPGFDTSQWVGNACVTGSGRRAVVVYAPREFTNQAELLQRGAFAAVVDLQTGAVTKLPYQVSLSYSDPGCGVGETAVLAQENDQETETRLLVLDTTTGKITHAIAASGQVTSGVPVGTSIVAAKSGQLTRFDMAGHARTLAKTSGSAFSIHPDGHGDIEFMDIAGQSARVHSLAGTKNTTVASGPLGSLDLHSGTGGRLFLSQPGHGPASLPAGLVHLDAPASAVVSTQGSLVINQAVSSTLSERVANPLTAVAPDQSTTVDIQSKVLGTGKALHFAVDPTANGKLQGGINTPSPALGIPSSAPATVAPKARTSAATPLAVSSPTSTVDDDRGCAIPRNDPAEQVLQPTPNQVEWAVDMAVRGDLTNTWVTQGGWRTADGLGTVSPQAMFPLPALTGGGRIPAQVLLGILAQESNLWQASYHALPGQTGNPLVGNFYGNPAYNASSPDAVWTVNWSKVDCGYGVGQQTDGMHSPDYLRPGDQVWQSNQQKAVALDYTSNIAVAAETLAEKWNELHATTLPAPITINNDSASSIENWFAAAWDYNEGFNPYTSASSAWGLGWGNNPANPIFDPNRLAFLDNNNYADAAVPQKWPYEEKVMGWAAWPLNTGRSFDDSGNPNSGNTAGYSAAWWTTGGNRTTVKPPLSTFCNSNNACDSTKPPKCTTVACYQGFWYTKSASWKLCASSACGNETLVYKTLRVEPGNGKAAPPDCDTSKLPSNALIIDSVSGSVPPMAGSCSRTWSNAGTLGFSFIADSGGSYEAKEDLHQIGGGFGSHFWFAHTRNDSHDSALMQVYGTWKLSNGLNGWTRVKVHIPDTGATTRQAAYTVHLGNGTVETRVLDQHYNQNTWVDLGVFHFVSGSDFQGAVLTNYTQDGTADDDIAWDAMAFVPLPAKPADFVVALGDSYSSGEGTGNYYINSNVDGGTASADACHRSPNAWSRQATLADSSSTVGTRADSVSDTTMDYHLIACSGAKTENILSVTSPPNAFGKSGTNENGELPQLDQGYLDSNTTLVTLSIGGNDSRFTPVLTDCITSLLLHDCADVTHSGDSAPLGTAEPALIAGQVHDSIVDVLSEIHKRAPNAQVILMGYPALFSNNGNCFASRITAAVISSYPIDNSIGVLASVADIAASTHIGPDATWMNQIGGNLNTAMAAAARDSAANVIFSNPTDAFNGQGVCGNPQTINDFVLTDTAGETPGKPLSQQTFHPTAAGALNYASALNSTLRSIGL